MVNLDSKLLYNSNGNSFYDPYVYLNKDFLSSLKKNIDKDLRSNYFTIWIDLISCLAKDLTNLSLLLNDNLVDKEQSIIREFEFFSRAAASPNPSGEMQNNPQAFTELVDKL